MSMNLVLERDGHDQPWGFRLQGGVDVGLPLSIQRVLVGTPAEAVLKRGDVVTKIGSSGTNGLSHQQAVDLFNCAGNKVDLVVKRAGAGLAQAAPSAQPSISTLQASAANRQQQQQQQQKAEPPQTQQGLVNAVSDHQKTPKVPAPVPVSGPIAGPVPVKLPPSPSLPATPAKYNSAAGLYANQSSGYLNKKPGMVNPTKSSAPPAPVVLNPGKEFNPTESATWKLLLESDAPPDLDKTRNYTAMNEHQPIYSEVYSAPKASSPGQRPVRPGFPGQSAAAGAPRPGSQSSPMRDGSPRVNPQEGGVSAVAAAALAQGHSASPGRSVRNEPIPIYETNSIGGRRRIAQSSSFNKLMMNMIGE